MMDVRAVTIDLFPAVFGTEMEGGREYEFRNECVDIQGPFYFRHRSSPKLLYVFSNEPGSPSYYYYFCHRYFYFFLCLVLLLSIDVSAWLGSRTGFGYVHKLSLQFSCRQT